MDRNVQTRKYIFRLLAALAAMQLGTLSFVAFYNPLFAFAHLLDPRAIGISILGGIFSGPVLFLVLPLFPLLWTFIASKRTHWWVLAVIYAICASLPYVIREAWKVS